jgi:hypothetical protein
MGAIDFIKHGSPEAVAKRGLVLAPLDAPGSVQEPSTTDAEGDPAVKEIEKCCVEWRAGRVKPRWIFLIDSKPTGSELSHPLYLCVLFFLTASNFDLMRINKRVWMCTTDQALAASVPRLLCRRDSPQFRRG